MSKRSETRNWRNNLPHYEDPGDWVFITISLLPGLYLTNPEKQLIFEAIGFYDKKLYDLFAMTVMNDHAHMFFEIKQSDQLSKISSYSDVVKRIKSYTAKELKRRHRNEVTQWWLEDYYDVTIFSEQEFFEVREYIRLNPVRSRYVGRSEEYPFLYLQT